VSNPLLIDKIPFTLRPARLLGAIVCLLGALPPAAAAYSQRVLCGSASAYTDTHGYSWAADQAYSAATGWGYTQAGLGTAEYTDVPIEDTYDRPLFQYERWGSPLVYRFDVPGPGTYFVKVLLAENYFGVRELDNIGNAHGIGLRVFNLDVNGQTLTNYDVLNVAGGRAARGLIEPFRVTIPEGGPNTIFLSLTPVVENPKISAIEISSEPTLTDTLGAYGPSSPGTDETFRLDCGGTKSEDADGTLWMADEGYALRERWGYLQGQARIRTPYTWADAAEYRQATWREGGTNFAYRFRLPNGTYRVTLLFAENEYQTEGQRVFDVRVNSRLLAADLDIYAQAGYRLPYSLQDTVTVTQETLDITFPRITAGLAAINAIEIQALQIADEDFLDFVERRALEYFTSAGPAYQTVNPANGLLAERANNFTPQQPLGFTSIAAVGFGLAALSAGVQRGWLPAAETQASIQTTVDFFNSAPAYQDESQNTLTHKNGFYFHFLDTGTGKRLHTGVELSSVDTTLLFAGLITAAGTFPGAPLSTTAWNLVQRADWQWFVNGHADGCSSIGWFPESGFYDVYWNAYNESPLVDFIGLLSSNRPLTPEAWYGMQRSWYDSGGVSYVIEQPSEPTPLFTHFFPQCYMDLRNQQDDKMRYDQNSTLAIQSDRQFCLDHAGDFPAYAQDCWGLSSGDSPPQREWDAEQGKYKLRTYFAYRTRAGFHDGTINPAMVGAAVAFNPTIAIPALRSLYFKYKHFLWGRFGFSDSFTLSAPQTLDPDTLSGKGWVSSDVLGIDLGPMILCLENYRTGRIWQTFGSRTEVSVALRRLGLGNLMMDNFENDASLNDQANARDAQWWSNDASVFTLSVANAIAGNNSSCLKATYPRQDVKPGDFIGIGNLSLGANMSYYAGQTLLTFHALGRETLQISFQDKTYRASALSAPIIIDSPDRWVKITLDLSTVNWQSCDNRQIQDIMLHVAEGQTGPGALYLDNITLGPGSAPPPPPPSQAATVNIRAIVAP